MQKKLLFITILLIVAVISGCSDKATQKADNKPHTYESKMIELAKELEDIRSSVPDPDYPIESVEDFDYEGHKKRLKAVYQEVKALRPSKELEPTHNTILRDLKFAMEGAELLEIAGNNKSKSIYSQALILLNSNLNDIDQMIAGKINI